jgi:HAMP domain-containing protein
MFRVMDQFPDEKHSSLAYKMLKGETGAMTIDFDGVKSYVAYKPIKDTRWVIDVVCPEEEVLGDYHHLIKLMLAVVILALLAITAFCYFFIHHEIDPLRTLEASAKQMTRGDYFAPVSTSGRQDEVGSLTKSFVAMRRSIRKHIDEIDRTREKLDEQNKALNEANEHIKEADRVKTAFLQNMTDQMDEPVREISFLVADLKTHYDEMSHEEIVELANQMEAHTDTVTSLLSRMLEVAIKGEEKESSV